MRNFALFILLAVSALAQSPSGTTVPKLVRFSGTLKPASSGTTPSVESVTLAVYRGQSGGAPLWQEVQNAEVDAEGRYSLLMGSTLNEGMPTELFASGEPRWLGVQVNRPGEVEQARVLLVSVPYALKASDAETLGGKPASAYALASGPAVAAANGASGSTAPVATNAVKPRLSAGSPGFIGMFTNSTDLGNSVMQQANGTIGLGTIPGANANTVPSLDLRTNPFSQIGMAQTTDYLTFFSSDTFGPAIYWNPGKDLRLGKGGAGLYNAFGFTEQLRIQSSTGNLGIGTQSPGSKLDVAGDINFTGAIRLQASPLLQIGPDTNGNPFGNRNLSLGIGGLPNISGLAGNTAIGFNVLHNNTAYGNTALGDSAMQSNTSGFTNVAIGAQALLSNTTGTDNTAIGTVALGDNTTGSHNVAIGFDALEFNVTGTGNIAIGYSAGSTVTGGGDNIHIGNQGQTGDFGTIRIGTKLVQGAFFAAGIRGVTTTNNDAIPVMIDSAGQLGTVSSSRRFKEDIADMGDVSRGIMDLRPVTYRYKQSFADGSKPVQYGLIAEEVAEVYPDLVAHSADGQIETVKYQVLDSMLLNEMQRLQRQNQNLQERLEKLEAALAKVVH